MTNTRGPKIRPLEDCKTLGRATLGTGSCELQDTSPLRDFDILPGGVHRAGTLRRCR